MRDNQQTSQAPTSNEVPRTRSKQTVNNGAQTPPTKEKAHINEHNSSISSPEQIFTPYFHDTDNPSHIYRNNDISNNTQRDHVSKTDQERREAYELEYQS